VSATLRYAILCNGEIIGHSELEDREPDLGLASGRFEPTDAYPPVAHVFRLFAEAQADGENESVPAKLAAYEEARAGLVLEVREAGGRVLAGAGVSITDVAGEAVLGVDVFFATPRGFAQVER
jgi:hypothetical protein